MAIRITVDLGNSSLKVRAWRTDPSRTGPGAFERLRGVELTADAARLGERLGGCLSEWRSDLDESLESALASVGGVGLEAQVGEALARFTDVAHLVPDPGLENRCRVPELVGRDRLWAARGALFLADSACLVVDAGTALTVDAVDRSAAGDVFLGGAIAPGPDLGARALAEWAARLPRVEPRPGVPALGRDTQEAIRAGLAIGFRGAARELTVRVAEEAGLERPRLVVTGGARRFLLLPTSIFDVEHLESEDLVHLGLLAAGFESR